jgi:hypothetical protein
MISITERTPYCFEVKQIEIKIFWLHCVQ